MYFIVHYTQYTTVLFVCHCTVLDLTLEWRECIFMKACLQIPDNEGEMSVSDLPLAGVFRWKAREYCSVLSWVVAKLDCKRHVQYSLTTG